MPPSTQPTCAVYRDLVDVAPDAMVAVEAASGVIRLVNARAASLFGHTREQLVGRPVEVLVPERFRDAHPWYRTAYVGDAAAGPMDDPGSELLALHRAGHEFPVDVWLTPLPNDGGQLVAVAIRDASERRALREASERMRDELIATVSHELRTPLTSILGYTEILGDMGEDVMSRQAARLLDVVRRNAERELKLVEDMLALALLGTSSLTVRPQPLDLGALAHGVVRDLEVTAGLAGVELVAEHLEPVWVDGDIQRLEQVVHNLLSNSIKFSPRGGTVEVRLASDEFHGVLEVEDQGTGVAPAELPLVFDRLYRPRDVVEAQVPGAGLGLPVVKGIVSAHDGEVDVSSQHGQGTKVQVRLPLAAAAMAV